MAPADGGINENIGTMPRQALVKFISEQRFFRAVYFGKSRLINVHKVMNSRNLFGAGGSYEIVRPGVDNKIRLPGTDRLMGRNTAKNAHLQTFGQNASESVQKRLKRALSSDPG